MRAVIFFFYVFLSSLIQTYTNPILHSDYSDPDVICVNGEYWMTSSSFNCIPGLQILHSTDLVNWQIVGAGIPSALTPRSQFDSPSHGCGVWAPSIRYFNGKYWIFWGDPDNGVFQIHADHPSQVWSEPVQVWEGKGIIDTCPLCDDDGRIYLVHAYAGSRAGFKSLLAVCELDAECTKFISEQFLVFDGKKTGDETIEGPKFYKRDGWYYIFAPSGGVKEGWQNVLRSRNVYGPYESRKVLHQGSTDIHGPHQGGWVDDAALQSWFIHFEDRYAYGRVVHLQPMKWLSDGWCTIGVDIDGDGVGEPVASYASPMPFSCKNDYPSAVSALSVDADFSGTSIPYNWQWHSNPQPDSYLLCPSGGYLRLNCIKHNDGWRNLWDTPNLLLEKVVGPAMELEAALVFHPSYSGDRAGVVVMGEDYSTLEMALEGDSLVLRRILCIAADKGAAEQIVEVDLLERKSFNDLYVKVAISKGGVCSFLYSIDGKSYCKAGEDFIMKEGRWIGAKVGFFATARMKRNDGGYLEVHRVCR